MQYTPHFGAARASLITLLLAKSLSGVLRLTLQELVELHRNSEPDGVAAVLRAVADEARGLAARSVEVYDNRLVFQMAAELDRIARNED